MKKTHLKKALALILAGAMMLMVCACIGDINNSKGTSTKSEPAESPALKTLKGFFSAIEDGDFQKAFSEYSLMDEEFYNKYGISDEYEYDEYCQNKYEELTFNYGDNIKIEYNHFDITELTTSQIEDLEESLEKYDISGIKEAYEIKAEYTISGDEDSSDESTAYIVIKYNGEYKIVNDELM